MLRADDPHIMILADVRPNNVTLAQSGICRLHPQLARMVAGMTVGEQPVQDLTAGMFAGQRVRKWYLTSDYRRRSA